MDSLPTDQNKPNFQPAQKSDDTEINIFDAHKYFNETDDSKPDHQPPSVPRSSSASSAGKSSGSSSSSSRQRAGAHAASSEASWSSRAGLLTTPPPINIHFSANCKWVSAARRWFSARRCCCNGEKCVRVKEERRRPVVLVNAGKTPKNVVEIHHVKAVEFSAVDAPRQQRISASGRSFMDGAVGFTFPIFSRDGATLCKQSQIPTPSPFIESLFGFRPMQEVPPTENPGLTARDDDDDVGSEASSDLFELESFSTQTTSYHRRKDSADDQDQTCIERRFAPAAKEINNIHDRRRASVDDPTAESKCFSSRNVTMMREEAKGDEGKQKTYGMMATSVGSAAAEMPTVFELHAGGRPLRAGKPPSRNYRSERLSFAFTV